MDKLKPVEHKIRGLVPRLFSPFFRKGRDNFQPLDGCAVKRVLFLRPDLIGDTVCSFPVFDNLRRIFPHIYQAILCSPKNTPVIQGDPRFERIFTYRKRIWKDITEVARIRREQYDVVFDMIADDSVTTLFLSQLCAPGAARIGIGKKRFAPYYDAVFDYDNSSGEHIIDLNLKLLGAVGIDSSNLDPFSPPYVDSAARAKADRYFENFPVAPGTIKIGYNLSAGKPTRMWPLEKAQQLLESILKAIPGSTVILFTVPKERARGDALISRFNQSVLQVPPGLTILEASALISRLDLFISADTSLVHVARSWNVPVVGLYPHKMRNFNLWRPYGQAYGTVMSEKDDNVFDITVDQVLSAFRDVMARKGVVTR